MECVYVSALCLQSVETCSLGSMIDYSVSAVVFDKDVFHFPLVLR